MKNQTLAMALLAVVFLVVPAIPVQGQSPTEAPVGNTCFNGTEFVACPTPAPRVDSGTDKWSIALICVCGAIVLTGVGLTFVKSRQKSKAEAVKANERKDAAAARNIQVAVAPPPALSAREQTLL